MIYEDIFRNLKKQKVQYLVVGGVAINLYGILRATADLDLMIQLKDDQNVERFISVLKKSGFRPRVPVSLDDFTDPEKRESWKKDKGALVMTFVKPNSFEQIDVFLENPLNFDNSYKRRKVATIGSLKISVISLDDLKKLKTIAGREKDRSDLQQIEKVKRLKSKK